MNSSQVFFPKLEALQFPELEALRAKMDAQSEPDLVRRMRLIGVPVTKDNFEVGDGLPMVHKQKAVFYIWDVGAYRRKAKMYGWKNKDPKYHVVICEKLQEMKEQGRFRQYSSIWRTDKFPVKLSNSEGSISLELTLCQYCLKQLELMEVYKPNEFPLGDWFDAIDDGYEPLPVDRILSKNKYIAAWKFLSWVCRKNAGWKCQQCGINLGQEYSDHRFLHAHHIRGTRYNKPEDLRALCIRCHAEQPGERHQKLKSYAEYQEFMKKYGDIS